IAVEVLPAVHFEAAQLRAMQVLVQPDRIRYRHDNHLATQLAGGLELRQKLTQMPRDEHAGQFVRVQRRLDIDFLPVARTIVKTQEVARGAERRRNEGMGFGLHDLLAPDKSSGSRFGMVARKPGARDAVQSTRWLRSGLSDLS